MIVRSLKTILSGTGNQWRSSRSVGVYAQTSASTLWVEQSSARLTAVSLWHRCLSDTTLHCSSLDDWQSVCALEPLLSLLSATASPTAAAEDGRNNGELVLEPSQMKRLLLVFIFSRFAVIQVSIAAMHSVKRGSPLSYDSALSWKQRW